MARKRRSRGEEEDGQRFPVDLTPMIDILFLLLIFFMVSARVFDPHGYTVELPETEQAPRKQGTTETPTLVVTADAKARFDGRTLNVDDPIPEELTTGDGPVELHADTNARHGDVIRWMDRLHAAGVRQVTLASTPLKEDRRRK